MKKKLSLTKTTVTRLNDLKQQNIKGGADSINYPCSVIFVCPLLTAVSCPSDSIEPCPIC